MTTIETEERNDDHDVVEQVEAEAEKTDSICPECAKRQQAERDESLQREYWALIRRASDMFSTRRMLVEASDSADCIKPRGRPIDAKDEVALLSNLARSIGLKCDAAIEQYAAEVQGEHPQLSEAISLLLELSRCGGSITPDDGITAEGYQQSQAVAKVNLHAVDAETWERLHALRDTLADMARSPQPFRAPEEDIPF